MAVIKEYISEGGAHIKVNDASMYTSQEEVEQAYRNWGRIARRILLNNQRRKEIENEKKEGDGETS